MGNEFKLQSVLNYRNILEQESQQQLAKILRTQGDLLVHLAHQRAELRYLCQDLEQKKLAGLPASELSLYNAHITLREQQISKLGQQLEDVNKQVILSREELVRTSQDRKMVEKLKTRHVEENRQQLNREENILLDEMAVQNRSGGLV